MVEREIENGEGGGVGGSDSDLTDLAELGLIQTAWLRHSTMLAVLHKNGSSWFLSVEISHTQDVLEDNKQPTLLSIEILAFIHITSRK